jgi:hypothetical protein
VAWLKTARRVQLEEGVDEMRLLAAIAAQCHRDLAAPLRQAHAGGGAAPTEKDKVAAVLTLQWLVEQVVPLLQP